ncbi:MAG: pyruvate, phosphate dikinase [Candidatus Limnocylindrales bacterium]
MTRAYLLDALPDLPLPELKALVGGKAAGLGVMIMELGLPVPPGFVITTETCRAYLATGWPDGLDEVLRARMTELEATVGRRFGDPADPLLVSVRSGAPVSMPGMMDTVLNLGLDDATTEGLARVADDAAFARSCRERFEASFRSTVGVDAPSEPWLQLRLAIEAVFRSWNSDRARAYRQKEGIADDLGTAVTVQAMVFGNPGPDSATGVLFTRNPATGERVIYGDILFSAQGEDVVAGTHRTEPIAVLDERLPTVAAELRALADRLERHFADLCDIEFTIESSRLWMLQVRVGKRSPQAALRMAVDMAEDETFPLTRGEAVERVVSILAHPPTIVVGGRRDVAPLVTGLPASPGVASGPIVTDPEAAQVAASEAGRAAILVRAQTSPDDVQGMASAAGILTSRGGLASHAAVVARGWGIPAIVGAAAVELYDDHVVLGDRSLRVGDVITIDGSTGEVFEGPIPIASEVVPEVPTLLAWAQELGISISHDEGAASDARAITDAGAARHATDTPRAGHDVSPYDCLRAIAIKGFAPAQAVADAVLSTSDAVQPMLDQLARDGLVSMVAGAYRLTESGTSRADSLRAAEQAAWGVDRASAALDAFVSLDRQVKEIVTAWQLRDAQAQVPNDHSDATYDQAVLDRLSGLHQDAVAWLLPLEADCPRLENYRRRLARAIDAAGAGDARFVASPRVDSYHGAWFELHDVLIRLAARTREAEVAEGRA